MAKPLTLDLRGLKCPLPVLKARRQMKEMPAGAELIILADDPAAPLDFDHFCQTGGHQMLDSAASDGAFTIRIAKAAS
jgi:tRNA 2-thiouridine synthesizing protein A